MPIDASGESSAQARRYTIEVPYSYVPVGVPTQQVMCPPFHVTMGTPELVRSHIGFPVMLVTGCPPAPGVAEGMVVPCRQPALRHKLVGAPRVTRVEYLRSGAILLSCVSTQRPLEDH